MKKILFLGHLFGFGGAEQSLLLLLTGLGRGRFKPILFCPPGGPSVRKARGLGIEVHTFNFFSPRGPKPKTLPKTFPFLDCLLLYRKVVGLDIDLIHCNTAAFAAYGIVLGLLLSKPVVVHLRSLEVYGVLNRILLRVFKSRACFIANSDATRISFINKGLINGGAKVIYNAIDPKVFHPGVFGGGFRKELGVREEEFLVGFVGRLDTGKGCFDFVEAAGILRGEQRVKWVLVGDAVVSRDPELLNKLKKKARESGLDNIFFTGFREDIPQVMKALDVLVVPSYYESFGRVVIEAMAVGTPVIGTAVGGIPEIVADEKSGLLVPVSDPKAIVAAVKRLIRDKSLGKSIKEEGLKEVQRKYSLDDQAKKVASIYEELIQ